MSKKELAEIVELFKARSNFLSSINTWLWRGFLYVPDLAGREVGVILRETRDNKYVIWVEPSKLDGTLFVGLYPIPAKEEHKSYADVDTDYGSIELLYAIERALWEK